jgi:DNA polymerase-3 subunit delta
MIIKEHLLDKIIRDNAQFLNILIYGPNEGLVKDQIEKLTKNYLSQGEYEEISFNGKDLDDDPGSLEAIIRSVSMFFKKKIVIADGIKDKHLSIVEEIVLKAPEEGVLIIREGSLSKSSKIRKFFEEHKTCLSLPCYEDDSRSIMKNIEEFTKKNKFELNRDIKNYLLQSLSNDRMISKRELEKIEIFYKNSNSEIKLEEIKILLNDSSSQNLNKMNEHVMFGNTSKSSKIINKLLSEGTSPISLVRSLINYLLRVQQTKIEMKKGNNFDSSIKILKPPVFWKDKDNFQKHCFKWPLRSIESSLKRLLETEVTCKLNSKLANINCEKSILLIANNGKQYFKN